MRVDFGFQPNCSESVFRFSRGEIASLPPDMQEAFWKAAAANYTEEDLERNPWGILGLPNPVPMAAESSLVPEEDDDFCLYYYQTSNEALIQFALSHLKKWLAELPFNITDGIPDRFLWEKEVDERNRNMPKGRRYEPPPFPKNSEPPAGYSGIIKLRQTASKLLKEQKKAPEKDKGN